jgi:hypothetical protein
LWDLDNGLALRALNHCAHGLIGLQYGTAPALNLNDLRLHRRHRNGRRRGGGTGGPGLSGLVGAHGGNSIRNRGGVRRGRFLGRGRGLLHDLGGRHCRHRRLRNRLGRHRYSLGNSRCYRRRLRLGRRSSGPRDRRLPGWSRDRLHGARNRCRRRRSDRPCRRTGFRHHEVLPAVRTLCGAAGRLFRAERLAAHASETDDRRLGGWGGGGWRLRHGLRLRRRRGRRFRRRHVHDPVACRTHHLLRRRHRHSQPLPARALKVDHVVRHRHSLLCDSSPRLPSPDVWYRNAKILSNRIHGFVPSHLSSQ